VVLDHDTNLAPHTRVVYSILQQLEWEWSENEASGLEMVWKWVKWSESVLQMGQVEWEWSGNGSSGVSVFCKWSKWSGSGLEMGQVE